MSTPRQQCKCHCTNCCTSTLPHCGIEPCNAEGVAAPLEPHIHEIDDFKTQRCTVCGKYLGATPELEISARTFRRKLDNGEFGAPTSVNAIEKCLEAYAAAVSKNLQEERDKLKAELDLVDEALARRPALAHIDHRYNKIFAACAGAAKSDRLESEIAALREHVSDFLNHDGGPGSIDYDAAKIFRARAKLLELRDAALRETKL